MPLACDPTSTHRIVLKTDQGKSPEPAFLYRFLTYRQFIELSDFQDGLKDRPADDSLRIQEVWLQRGLVGWEHITDPDTGQPMPFDAARIMDVVGMFEAQEILGQRMMGNLPSLEDKKKLPSPSASDTAKPAADAKDSTPAPTAPASSCP